MDRPIILLDVDGVLAPVCEDDTPEGDDNLWDEWRPAAPGSSVAARGLSIAEPVAEFFCSVSESADVLWHTTWRENAQSIFAPAFGLPHFELLESSDSYLNSDIWWKLEAVEMFVAMNPELRIIWVDDDITDAINGGEISPELLRNPNLSLVSPSWKSGISPRELEQIKRTVVEWSS